MSDIESDDEIVYIQNKDVAKERKVATPAKERENEEPEVEEQVKREKQLRTNTGLFDEMKMKADQREKARKQKTNDYAKVTEQAHKASQHKATHDTQSSIFVNSALIEQAKKRNKFRVPIADPDHSDLPDVSDTEWESDDKDTTNNPPENN